MALSAPEPAGAPPAGCAVVAPHGGVKGVFVFDTPAGRAMATRALRRGGSSSELDAVPPRAPPRGGGPGEGTQASPAQSRPPALESLCLWSPERCPLAAALALGVDELGVGPGRTVLCLGVGGGETVCRLSDVVGSRGRVYAVEKDPGASRGLVRICRQRPNVVPIVADARSPFKYASAAGAVDALVADLDRPDDEASILAANALHFLKPGGTVVLVAGPDGGGGAAAVERGEAALRGVRHGRIRDVRGVELEPYQKGSAVVTGVYHPHRTRGGR